MKKSLSPLLSRRLETHFLTCSAIVAGVSTFTATKAGAAVVYSGVVNSPIQPSSVNGGVYFDFELPGTITQGSRFDTWDVNPYESGTKFYINSNTSMVATGTGATNLLAGTVIGPDSIYNAVSDRVLTVTPTESDHLYLGFKFNSNNPGGGPMVMYGWAQLKLNAGAPGNLVSFAYDDSGAPIAAGVVPEPSSLGLLALGSLGLSQWRRRRTA